VVKDIGNVTFVGITPDVSAPKGDILRVKVVSVAVRIAPHFANLAPGCDLADIIIGIDRESDS